MPRLILGVVDISTKYHQALINNSELNMSEQEATRACEARSYEVTRKDLPLSCPMPSMRVWDAHPKVFLPIEKTGHAICPYCGAQYTLKD